MKKPLTYILVLIFCFMSVVPVWASKGPRGMDFIDVKPGHWAYGAVTKMGFINIIKGFPNGNFYPGKTVSREEFAVMLVLAADLQPVNPKTPTFEDVPRNHWAYAFVEAAKPYLTGYTEDGKNYFEGAGPALREDVAAAIIRIKRYENKTPDLEHFNEMFTDEDLISPELKKLAAIAVEAKIMTGFPDKTFRGKESLKRAEAAVLIWKAGLINPKLQEGIAAEVNGEPVSLETMISAYNKRVIALQNQGADFTGSGGEQMLQGLKEKTLEEMIESVILLQKAKEMGIYPSKEDVFEELKQIKQQFGDEEAFRKALEEYNYTEDDIIERLAFDLSLTRLYDQVTAGLVITEKDIKDQLGDHYQEYKDYSQEKKEETEMLIKQTKFQDYLDGLIDSADIEIYLPFKGQYT